MIQEKARQAQSGYLMIVVLAVAQLGLVGRHLHGDREEALVIALQMRLQQRLELLSTSHRIAPTAARFRSYAEHLHDLVPQVIDHLDGDAP